VRPDVPELLSLREVSRRSNPTERIGENNQPTLKITKLGLKTYVNLLQSYKFWLQNQHARFKPAKLLLGKHLCFHPPSQRRTFCCKPIPTTSFRCYINPDQSFLLTFPVNSVTRHHPPPQHPSRWSDICQQQFYSNAFPPRDVGSLHGSICTPEVICNRPKLIILWMNIMWKLFFIDNKVKRHKTKHNIITQKKLRTIIKINTRQS